MGYRVIGGTKFYERAEIKDSVAFLRIVNQKMMIQLSKGLLMFPKDLQEIAQLNNYMNGEEKTKNLQKILPMNFCN